LACKRASSMKRCKERGSSRRPRRFGPSTRRERGSRGRMSKGCGGAD
jgi:hypothetical protein